MLKLGKRKIQVK